MRSFFVVLLLSLQAQAQSENKLIKKLSWADCIQLAQQNNLELQIAQDNVTSADENTTVARSGFLPHVFATATGNQTSLNKSVTNSYSATLGFSQNIFAGFADFYKTKQSNVSLKIAQMNLKIAKAKLSADLKQAYESLLYGQSFILLTQDILKRRQSDLQNVQLRFNSGRENKGSVLLSKAYSAQAEYENLQAENALASARETLSRVLGLPANTELQLLEAKSSLTRVNAVKLSESQVADMATLTPDYLLAELQEQSADLARDTAKANFYPSLDFTGSYGKTDNVFFPEENDRWSLGLTFTLPLFDGGRDYASVKSAAAKWAAASKTRESLLLQMKVRLRDAYSDYVETAEKAKVDMTFRSAAEVRAEIARSKYNNGLMTFDDWDVVENDLISRQKASLSSARASVISEANWELIQGIGVIQ
ncbi:TolC family protein [Bdellovibrio sp. qaytius]|nr:TolC family protein [Bdellovibrio sp. qaytius]